VAQPEITTPLPAAPAAAAGSAIVLAPAQPRKQAEQSGYQLNPFIPAWAIVVIGLLLIFSMQRAYTRTTRHVSVVRRVGLGGIRMLVFAVVLFCLARPVLVKTYQLSERGLCFAVLDTSASMALRDMPNFRTRWESATGIIRANTKQMAALSEKFELQRYLFDTRVRAVSRLPGEDAAADKSAPAAQAVLPAGTSTDIAAVMEVLGADAGGTAVAGALLITDGRHNLPKDIIPSAISLERSGVPLFVIGLGQDATPIDYKDIKLRQIIAPEKGFIGAKMMMRIEVESTLPAPASVPFKVEINGKLIHQSKVAFPAGTNVVLPVIEIPYTPEALGVHRLVATLGTIPDEANLANNARAAFFRVYRTKLGIWYVEGAIRKEFGAIRSALETAPNVSMRALNAFMAKTGNRSDLLPVSAEDRAQLKLVILGDLRADRFEPTALQYLAKFVADGGAVLMIGGIDNMGAGGWQNSPLAEVFPAEMSSSDAAQEGPLRIEIENGEMAHPVLQIGDTPAQIPELIRLLPPMPGVSRIRGLRPGARVLLRAGPSELLVVKEYGKGRAAIFTGDTTWQWILKANQGETHKRFWRNLTTWLTRSDYRDTEKAVFTDSERLQYMVGEEALFRAYVHETEKVGAAVKGARISATLTRIQADGEVPVLTEDIGQGVGEHAKRFTPGAAGAYRFKVSAIGSGGAVIDSDSVDIQVAANDIEHDNPKANLKLLRRIATLSGGAYYEPEQAREAFTALLRRDVSFSKPVTEVQDVWNLPAVLAVFIGLLALEWVLRKKWGLI